MSAPTPFSIQTYRGCSFDLLNPHSSQIDTDDLSMALSQLNRFSGHTLYPYSVGQHSLLVAHLLFETNQPNQVILQGLLHDAAEAYVGEIAAPLKKLLPELTVIETGIWAAICERFGLDVQLSPAVRLASALADRAEALELLRAPAQSDTSRPGLSVEAEALMVRPYSSCEVRRMWKQAVERRLLCRRAAV